MIITKIMESNLGTILRNMWITYNTICKSTGEGIKIDYHCIKISVTMVHILFSCSRLLLVQSLVVWQLPVVAGAVVVPRVSQLQVSMLLVSLPRDRDRNQSRPLHQHSTHTHNTWAITQHTGIIHQHKYQNFNALFMQYVQNYGAKQKFMQNSNGSVKIVPLTRLDLIKLIQTLLSTQLTNHHSISLPVLVWPLLHEEIPKMASCLAHGTQKLGGLELVPHLWWQRCLV